MIEPAAGLERDCEAAELAAVSSWNEALPSSLSATLGTGHRSIGGGLLVHAAADVLMFNRVLGLGVAQPASETDIDGAIEVFSNKGAKRFMVQVAPHAEPGELVSWLEARGFYRHNHWIRLTRDLTTAAPEPRTDLSVAIIGREHADDVGRMGAEAFGYPPELAAFTSCLVGRDGWTFFGAFADGTLAGVSAMHIQGAAAWFGFAATRKELRGRGAQSALIAARLEAAKQAGCRWACVETAADTPEKPNPSTHNLRRLGFADAYVRPNWVKVLRGD
jgi:GNAT superfamily N-acetyltransferase